MSEQITYNDLVAWFRAHEEAEEQWQIEVATPLLLFCNPREVFIIAAGVRAARDTELARTNHTRRVRHVTVCPSWAVPEGTTLMQDPLKVPEELTPWHQ